MTEEIKQERESKNIFSTLFKIILGLVFLILGVWAIIALWNDLLVLIKGSIGLFLLLAGIIILAIAKE